MRLEGEGVTSSRVPFTYFTVFQPPSYQTGPQLWLRGKPLPLGSLQSRVLGTSLVPKGCDRQSYLDDGLMTDWPEVFPPLHPLQSYPSSCRRWDSPGLGYRELLVQSFRGAPHPSQIPNKFLSHF